MKLVLSKATVLFLLLLVGCAAVPEKDVTVEGAQEGEGADTVVQPFDQPPTPVDQLDSEIVFNALAGEVAAQRHELSLAYEHLLKAAALSGDAKAAERAARLAIFLKRDDLALEAVGRWVELAPNDLSARQLGAALALRSGELEQAYSQLKAVVAISVAKGQGGFLYAMAAVSREKNHKGAVGLLERLAADYPDEPMGLYVVSLSALMGKSYDLAQERASQLIERHPGWVKGYVLLSRIHVALNGNDAARDLLARAVEQYPEEKLLRSAYGRILLEFGEKELSYQQFQQISRQTPDDGDVLFPLGVLALDMERFREARRHFQQLRKLELRMDEAAYYLGRIDESQGRAEKAIEWYRKVQKGDVSYYAQVRIAKLMAGDGRLVEARDWLKNMRIRIPNQSVRLYLEEVEVVREHGSSAQVMSLYDEALRAHSDDQDILYSRALYAGTLDRIDILERDLRKVLAANPENANALNALGYTLADQTTRFDEALELITRALELKPEAPAIIDSMGWIQYRLGNLEKALGYLKKAMSMLPDSEFAAHLGEVLWVMGEQAEARAVWKKALKEEPESKHILETMQRLTK
ncbi:tetratricopeptide repeat protein [Solemya velesiana gill symbiont]|uniref:Tetratricopeptide repeat-like domain-containing protein n=1 Tax=Solemya velesiana gill symbiont TaxID=1918948 RepID=A0A1T2KY36_9GAMM|nr:tetratricopeptide repeat protein [Solemya velesiana gill symbiont]OOZ37777.1 hypothetical protein BOW51_00485 [Solemya velesiana gill symbiont]